MISKVGKKQWLVEHNNTFYYFRSLGLAQHFVRTLTKENLLTTIGAQS